MAQVQRHLQLRIEAQGKYLQSVLEKAQEALAKQSVHLDGGETPTQQLSELISRATVTRRVQVQQEHLHHHQRHLGGDGSVDSCLTACEGSQCQRERERDQDLLFIGLSSAAPPHTPSRGYNNDRGGATASAICEEFLFLDEPGRRGGGGGGGSSDDHDQQELDLSINGRSNPPRPRDSQRIDLNGSSWN